MKLHDTKAVARFLDVSERRVRQLRDEKIIDEVRPGLYDLLDANRRYINYLRKRNPESEEAVDYNTERALRENQLHSSEDVEQVLTNMLINFRSRLMAIPARLSPILSKKTDKTEIFKILKAQVDEALNELSDFNALFGEGAESGNEESDG